MGSMFPGSAMVLGFLLIPTVLVVLATSLSIKEAEVTLNDMVDGFRIKMDVADSGIVRYEFFELLKSHQSDPTPGA